MGVALTLFGGASLEADGSPVTGSAAQRHRLALLSLLVTAPAATMARDKLMAYLWPERDSDSARKLLNQAVYALRRALADDAILSLGEELRLNAAVVRSDVADFLRAVDTGDHQRAVDLYGGPFMDGFFLGEAPEFEHWVSRERERLAGAHANALEELAVAAGAARDHGRAAELWKVRAAQDPYDSRIAVSLMQALEAAGNPAGAVQYATIHERLLRDEFDMGPSAEVAALTERLRHAQPRSSEQGGTAAPDATDSGLAARSERPSDRPAPVQGTPLAASRKRGRTREAAGWGIVTLILLSLVVGALRLSGRRVDALVPDRTASIAVLPLANLSADPNDAVLADAMTEELITVLARADNLRVVPSTSVFAMRADDTDVRSIGETLQVANILEGGFQKIGSRIRVRVRLVDAAGGTTRWSEVYDRDLQDVFAVQDEIARAVARELGLRLGAAADAAPRRQPTQNIAAYELYLRGNDPALLRSESAARKGLELFIQAVALDSTYAAAWAGLGRMYGRIAGDMGRTEQDHYVALAVEALRKALDLDETLAEAHAILGGLHTGTGDFAAAEHHLSRAIELDATIARTHEWMVTLQLWMGRPARALEHARRALELEPLSPSAHAELARALLANKRCDEALAQLDNLAGVEPPLLRAAPLAATAYGCKGLWSMAIAELRTMPNVRQSRQDGLLGYLLARSGERDQALLVLRSMLDEWDDDAGDAGAIAIVYAGLGDLDEAFAWLHRFIDERPFAFGPGRASHFIVTGPFFEDLRRDPRFERWRDRLYAQNR
jgi:adenylate cyclase